MIDLTDNNDGYDFLVKVRRLKIDLSKHNG